MATFFDQHGYLTVVGPDSVSTIGIEGFKQMSIRNKSTSTTNATLSGSSAITICGRPNGSIVLLPGDDITIGSGESSVDGDLIDVPSGCTVEIVAVQTRPISS